MSQDIPSAAASAVASAPAPAASTAPVDPSTVRLFRRQDQLHVRHADGRELPVRLVLCRPVSAPGGEMSLVDRNKTEVAFLPSLDVLDAESRQTAQAELELAYVVPRITRVLSTVIAFNNRYWEVETDRGARRFAMSDPRRNIAWRTPDHLLIRDVLGCRFEISSLKDLDPASRLAVERVL